MGCYIRLPQPKKLTIQDTIINKVSKLGTVIEEKKEGEQGYSKRDTDHLDTGQLFEESETETITESVNSFSKKTHNELQSLLRKAQENRRKLGPAKKSHSKVRGMDSGDHSGIFRNKMFNDINAKKN